MSVTIGVGLDNLSAGDQASLKATIAAFANDAKTANAAAKATASSMGDASSSAMSLSAALGKGAGYAGVIAAGWQLANSTIKVTGQELGDISDDFLDKQEQFYVSSRRLGVFYREWLGWIKDIDDAGKGIIEDSQVELNKIREIRDEWKRTAEMRLLEDTKRNAIAEQTKQIDERIAKDKRNIAGEQLRDQLKIINTHAELDRIRDREIAKAKELVKTEGHRRNVAEELEKTLDVILDRQKELTRLADEAKKSAIEKQEAEKKAAEEAAVKAAQDKKDWADRQVAQTKFTQEMGEIVETEERRAQTLTTRKDIEKEIEDLVEHQAQLAKDGTLNEENNAEILAKINVLRRRAIELVDDLAERQRQEDQASYKRTEELNALRNKGQSDLVRKILDVGKAQQQAMGGGASAGRGPQQGAQYGIRQGFGIGIPGTNPFGNIGLQLGTFGGQDRRRSFAAGKNSYEKSASAPSGGGKDWQSVLASNKDAARAIINNAVRQGDLSKKTADAMRKAIDALEDTEKANKEAARIAGILQDTADMVSKSSRSRAQRLRNK